MLSSVPGQKFKEIHTHKIRDGLPDWRGDHNSSSHLTRGGQDRNGVPGLASGLTIVLWLGLDLVSSLRCVLLLLDSDMDTGAKEVTKKSLG